MSEPSLPTSSGTRAGDPQDASPVDLGDRQDASPRPRAQEDASRGAGTPARLTGPGAPCDWCGEPIPAVSPETGRRTRDDAEVCGSVHRKARWRFRKAVLSRAGTPERDRSGTRPVHQVGPEARFAYADPPYPGKSDYYRDQPTYGGEVDHAALVARLVEEFPDGWALSTSSEALYDVLPLCPRGVRVCVWRRRVRVTRSSRPLSAWEPLLVVGGRALSTAASQDALDDVETGDVVLSEVLDYRGRYDAFPGALVGMKPPEFAVWLFQQLGARPGDELADLFPGSGAIGRAWALYTSYLQGEDLRDASPVDVAA